jgi:hypothetical protein
VEILNGLTEGDVIVVEGTQKVRDGAPVKPLQNEALQAERDAA